MWISKLEVALGIPFPGGYCSLLEMCRVPAVPPAGSTEQMEIIVKQGIPEHVRAI